MTAPKKPQDHLPAKTADAEEPKPEGWDLMKPFDQVPVWDQVDLIEIVKPLIPNDAKDGERVEIDLQNVDLRIIGELAKRLQDFALDRESYLTFMSGPDALNHAVTLGIAYAMQLGESERSASS